MAKLKKEIEELIDSSKYSDDEQLEVLQLIK